MFQSSRLGLEDSLLDAAKVPRAELHFINQQLTPLDVEPPHFIGVVVGVESIAVHRQNVAVCRHCGDQL